MTLRFIILFVSASIVFVSCEQETTEKEFKKPKDVIRILSDDMDPDHSKTQGPQILEGDFENVIIIQQIDRVDLTNYRPAQFVVPQNSYQGAPPYFILNGRQYLVGSKSSDGVKNYMGRLDEGQYQVFLLGTEAVEGKLPGMNPRQSFPTFHVAQFVLVEKVEEETLEDDMSSKVIDE